jgi:hypothetical protein
MFLNSRPLSIILFLTKAEVPGLQKQIGTALTNPKGTPELS